MVEITRCVAVMSNCATLAAWPQPGARLARTHHLETTRTKKVIPVPSRTLKARGMYHDRRLKMVGGAGRVGIGQQQRGNDDGDDEAAGIAATTTNSTQIKTSSSKDSSHVTVVAVTVGAAGALAGKAMGASLPWMLGSLTSTSVASLAGARLAVSAPLKKTAQAVVGISLGANFTPEMIHNILDNGLTSMAVLILFTGCAAAASCVYLAKVAGYDLTTAFFAGAPGGLNDMLAIGSDLGGDARIIGLTHACRLAIVLTVLPQMLSHFGGAVSPLDLNIKGTAWVVAAAAAEVVNTRVSAGASSGLCEAAAAATLSFLSIFLSNLKDIALLVTAGVVGPTVGRVLRLPARFVIGPMICSAALHLTGFTAVDAKPPAALLRAAQCIIATSIGVKFAGVSISRVACTFAHAFCSTGILLGVAAAFSVAVCHVTGAPWPLVLLAYSPGGITEACVTALALGMDTGYVAAHHLVRITSLIIAAPAAHELMSAALGGSDSGKKKHNVET